MFAWYVATVMAVEKRDELRREAEGARHSSVKAGSTALDGRSAKVAGAPSLLARLVLIRR